jgi:hypothetical protein
LCVTERNSHEGKCRDPPVDQIDELMRIVAEATDKEQEMIRGEVD